MKRLLVILSLFFGYTSFAQVSTDYDNVKLETPEDCKAAEPIALEASSYLFITPYQKDDIARLNAISFLIKWMSATPDYTFSLDSSIIKITKGNSDLLGLYMAAMAKYCLENKATAKDQKIVTLNAVTTILNYCEVERNNFPLTKQLRKLSEARAKGELGQAL